MKWGIIATGRIARKFAQTLNEMKNEGQALVAVASRKMETAEAFASEFNIPKAYDSYEKLIQDSEIEAVYIATPNNLHYENTKLCLKRGKHVLCEKPFTLKADQASELYDIAKEKGLFLMEALWIAHLPALLQAQKWIKSGATGEIKTGRVDYGFSLGPERRYRKFAPELGGGALWDIGVYNLGFLRLMMNQSPETWTGNFHKNEYGTDDFSVINLTYKDGKTATATTSIGIDIPRKAIIQGTDALIQFEDFQHAETVSLTRYDGKTEKLDFPVDINGFEYQIREVSRGVAEGKSFSSVYSPQMSVDTIKLLEDITNNC